MLKTEAIEHECVDALVKDRLAERARVAHGDDLVPVVAQGACQ